MWHLHLLCFVVWVHRRRRHAMLWQWILKFVRSTLSHLDVNSIPTGRLQLGQKLGWPITQTHDVKWKWEYNEAQIWCGPCPFKFALWATLFASWPCTPHSDFLTQLGTSVLGRGRKLHSESSGRFAVNIDLLTWEGQKRHDRMWNKVTIWLDRWFGPWDPPFLRGLGVFAWHSPRLGGHWSDMFKWAVPTGQRANRLTQTLTKQVKTLSHTPARFLFAENVHCFVCFLHS